MSTKHELVEILATLAATLKANQSKQEESKQKKEDEEHPLAKILASSLQNGEARKEEEEECQCSECRKAEVLRILKKAIDRVEEVDASGIVISILSETEDKYRTDNIIDGKDVMCARSVASLFADFVAKASKDDKADTIAMAFATLEEEVVEKGDHRLYALFAALGRRLGARL